MGSIKYRLGEGLPSPSPLPTPSSMRHPEMEQRTHFLNSKLSISLFRKAALRECHRVEGLVSTTVNKNGRLVSLGFVSHELNLQQLGVFTHEEAFESVTFGSHRCSNRDTEQRDPVFSTDICLSLGAPSQDHLYPAGHPCFSPILPVSTGGQSEDMYVSLVGKYMGRPLVILLRNYQNLCPGNMPCCHGNKKTAHVSPFCLAFLDLFNTFLADI